MMCAWLKRIPSCLRVGTLTGCPLRSNKDQEFPARWCFIFFYPPCTSRGNWVRPTTSFKLPIEIFSFRKTLTSDHFVILDFSLKKKFTDEVTFSHADALTGCSLDASNIIIKFRAYGRLICWYPPRMSGETDVGMSMAFSSSMNIFIVCTSHECGRVHSIFFCGPSTSTPICCSILQ